MYNTSNVESETYLLPVNKHFMNAEGHMIPWVGIHVQLSCGRGIRCISAAENGVASIQHR